jgi:hypothetical protein
MARTIVVSWAGLNGLAPPQRVGVRTAFGDKADISRTFPNVCFLTQSGHGNGSHGCNERHNSLTKNVIFFSYPM